MARELWFATLLLVAALGTASCDSRQPDPTVAPAPEMPNPAAVHCQEMGLAYEIRTAADGSQSGVCILPDGTECDEWAYYRGDCPTETPPPTLETNLPNAASVHCEANGGRVELRRDANGVTAGICILPDGSECDEWANYRGECGPAVEQAEDGWQVYRNETLGYTLHYPPDAVITDAEDAAQTFTIQGPLVDDEYWPVIFVSHRWDDEAFRPPAGVALDDWLIDHNLIAPPDQGQAAEIRQADVQIAGVTAIHTRFARSPQSYAYDKYFFAHEGQLYQLLILHSGDREDWQLYDHFLESFQFE